MLNFWGVNTSWFICHVALCTATSGQRLPYSPSYHITFPPNLYATSPQKKVSRFPCPFPFLDVCSSKTSTLWVAGSTHVGSLQDFPGLEMVGSGGSPDIVERCVGGRWKLDEKPSTRMRSCWYLPRWWFQIFFDFHPEPWGNDPIWRAYFSNGLVQPPTSYPLVN